MDDRAMADAAGKFLGGLSANATRDFVRRLSGKNRAHLRQYINEGPDGEAEALKEMMLTCDRLKESRRQIMDVLRNRNNQMDNSKINRLNTINRMMVGLEGDLVARYQHLLQEEIHARNIAVESREEVQDPVA